MAGSSKLDRLVMRLNDVESVLAALDARPFLIVSGLSGTGKTQLVRRLAESISRHGMAWTRQALAECRRSGRGGRLPHGDLFAALPGHPGHVAVADLLDLATGEDPPLHARRVAFQPVRPDWNDSKKIWGHYNPLSGRFHPSDALVVLLNAYRSFLVDPEHAAPHFIVLDEMNLARVEYYLSDLLSLMEAGCRVDPHDPRVVHLGEMARVHPLESCVTSLGQRGIAMPPPAPQVEEGGADPFLSSGWGPPARGSSGGTSSRGGVSMSRPTSDDQLVPLWELEEEAWLYEPLIKASRTVVRQAAESGAQPSAPVEPGRVVAPLDPPARRRTPLEQIFPIPPRIACPPNLVVVGTVNVDETTHGFAPKVLDRAFVVELSQVDYAAAFDQDPSYPRLRALLEQLHGILAPWELQLGYRVVAEMLEYVALNPARPPAEVEDELIRAKVLTRLSGSEERLAEPLRELLQLCLHGPGGGTEAPLPPPGELCRVRQIAELPGGAIPCYPESARKLLGMIRRLVETGFTSYF